MDVTVGMGLVRQGSVGCVDVGFELTKRQQSASEDNVFRTVLLPWKVMQPFEKSKGLAIWENYTDTPFFWEN